MSNRWEKKTWKNQTIVELPTTSGVCIDAFATNVDTYKTMQILSYNLIQMFFPFPTYTLSVQFSYNFKTLICLHTLLKYTSEIIVGNKPKMAYSRDDIELSLMA